jgi:hypothetical protein
MLMDKNNLEMGYTKQNTSDTIFIERKILEVYHMLIDTGKIITPEDLNNDFEGVLKKVNEVKEAFVFQNNKPTHVFMTIEQYQSSMTEGATSFSEPSEEISDESLETLLNKVGKKIFIDYYSVFKEDDNPEEKLAETSFTLNSRRSRSSSARKIFRDGLEVAALNNIIQSSRLEDETINRAKEILEAETGRRFEMKLDLDFDEEDENDFKIGKMVRTLVTKFIQDEKLTESEIELMTQIAYSREVFKLNFAVLKTVDKDISHVQLDELKRDSKGYNRYYDTPVTIGNSKHLICSQWVENLHKAAFEKWLREKLYEILITLVDELEPDIEFTIKGLLNAYWTYVPYQTRKSLGKEFYNQFKDDLLIQVLDKRNNVQVYKKLGVQ